MVTQSSWVSALRAHLSQWSWLGTGGQQSSCTGHVLISHTECGSDVGISKSSTGSEPDAWEGQVRTQVERKIQTNSLSFLFRV